jgi:hypothetical protein
VNAEFREVLPRDTPHVVIIIVIIPIDLLLNCRVLGTPEEVLPKPAILDTHQIEQAIHGIILGLLLLVSLHAQEYHIEDWSYIRMQLKDMLALSHKLILHHRIERGGILRHYLDSLAHLGLGQRDLLLVMLDGFLGVRKILKGLVRRDVEALA